MTVNDTIEYNEQDRHLALVPGTTVVMYHGSRRDMHGAYVVTGLCPCCSDPARLQLAWPPVYGGDVALSHVHWRSIGAMSGSRQREVLSECLGVVTHG